MHHSTRLDVVSSVLASVKMLNFNCYQPFMENLTTSMR